MQVSLLTEEEHYSRVRSRLDTREWWCVLSFTADPATMEGTIKFEKQFYSGENSRFFEVMIGGLLPGVGLVGISFGKKSCASPRAVAKWAREQGRSDVTASMLKERDILCFAQSAIYAPLVMHWFDQTFGSYDLPDAKPIP